MISFQPNYKHTNVACEKMQIVLYILLLTPTIGFAECHATNDNVPWVSKGIAAAKATKYEEGLGFFKKHLECMIANDPNDKYLAARAIAHSRIVAEATTAYSWHSRYFLSLSYSKDPQLVTEQFEISMLFQRTYLYQLCLNGSELGRVYAAATEKRIAEFEGPPVIDSVLALNLMPCFFPERKEVFLSLGARKM
jgi:hypothetical protein